MNGGQKEEYAYYIKPQKDFPLMDEYRKLFAITNKTIFALADTIYTDYDLTPDLLVHELVHLEQQRRVGTTEWVYDFLEYPDKRLKYELEAYRKQLQSIKDRNYRAKVRWSSADNLSSPLYGNIISRQDAFDLLKV